MGLPQILIDFKAKAETAIARSQNGIVAVVLLDTTKADTTYSYSTMADVKTADWTTKNVNYLKLIFEGSPRKVLVERISTAEGLEGALNKFKNKTWNYITIPGITGKTQDLVDFVKAQRASHKTFKAVLPCTIDEINPNDEGIVDFANTSVTSTIGGTYTGAEYCARIAGLLAGLPLTESATYYTLADIVSIAEIEDPDTAIDNGQFIIINDGELFRVGRAVNSLHIISGNKTEDMKKIKIIEGMDIIRDDITKSFKENYIGVNNTYANKLMLISSINQYFRGLVTSGVLYDEYENVADIDIDAQRAYLADRYDVSDYSDEQIKIAKTGTQVFVKANVQFVDAIEDLSFVVNME